MSAKSTGGQLALLWDSIRAAQADGRLDLGSLAKNIRRLGASDLKQFQRQLGLALHLLDREDIYMAANNGDGERDNRTKLSADGFLYLRAGVVAQGETFFQGVIEDPTVLHTAPDSECEELLYIVQDATGQEISFGRDIETGSWKSKWSTSNLDALKGNAEDDEWAIHWLSLVDPASHEEVDAALGSPPVYSDNAFIWLNLEKIGRILYDVSRWIASTDRVRMHVERASGIEPLIEGPGVTEVRTELRTFGVVNAQDDWPVATIPIPRKCLSPEGGEDLKLAVWKGALDAVEQWCSGDEAAKSEIERQRHLVAGC